MAGRMRERMIQVVMDADLGFALPVEYDAAEAIVDGLLASNEVIPFGAAGAMVGEFAAERDRYREALEEIADPTSSAADAYAERSEWASGWRAGYRHAAEIARQALDPEESDSG